MLTDGFSPKFASREKTWKSPWKQIPEHSPEKLLGRNFFDNRGFLGSISIRLGMDLIGKERKQSSRH